MHRAWRTASSLAVRGGVPATGEPPRRRIAGFTLQSTPLAETTTACSRTEALHLGWSLRYEPDAASCLVHARRLGLIWGPWDRPISRPARRCSGGGVG